jgi:hypothetical protein
MIDGVRPYLARSGLGRLDQSTKVTHMCQLGLARWVRSQARCLFQLKGIVT